MGYMAAQTRIATRDCSLSNVLTLHRVFLDQPELRPYFFEGKDLEETHPCTQKSRPSPTCTLTFLPRECWPLVAQKLIAGMPAPAIARALAPRRTLSSSAREWLLSAADSRNDPGAEEDKAATAAILKLADGEGDAADVARQKELEYVMRLFRPTHMGGLGTGQSAAGKGDGVGAKPEEP
jgi:hypothetical protein